MAVAYIRLSFTHPLAATFSGSLKINSSHQLRVSVYFAEVANNLVYDPMQRIIYWDIATGRSTKII